MSGATGVIVKTTRVIARDDQKATDQVMQRCSTPFTAVRCKSTAR
jgi:hypothetical protein